MYPLYFPALLKAENDTLLEIGEACIAEQENSVIFNSEFVPLIKLGATAHIVRTLGGEADGEQETLERFTGRVYLSSRKLLQITDIPAEVMEKARAIFTVNENAPVQLALAPGASPQFNIPKSEKIAGHLRYIGVDCIKLMAMEFIPVGQLLAVSLESPGLVLCELKARVIERIPLKRNAAILRCELLPPSPENQQALRAFLDRGLTPFSL